MSKLTFLNHASYMIETKKSLLIIDPWFEGYAFDKGWALLDNSTTNEVLIDLISATNKEIYIWLSHEHSDHFSVPFVMNLKKCGLCVNFFFQRTLDRRVATFIRNMGFSVVESNDTKENIDSELSIVTFPFSGGDSYCLTLCKEFSLLNLNDCVIKNEIRARSVMSNIKKYTTSIDLLMTQFGYANWLGNRDEKELRISAAKDKLTRIRLQIEHIKPKYVIPFASFIYFCHKENFHTNDMQNTPEDVKEFFNKNDLDSKLIMVKPMDKLDLSQNLFSQSSNSTQANIQHWNKLISKIKPHDLEDKVYSKSEIINEYKVYKKKIFISFLFVPAILEKLKFITSIQFYIHDLDINLSLSYITGIKIVPGEKDNADIGISSSTMIFILKNDYGMNTTVVNGKLVCLSDKGIIKFERHFLPQEYMKKGYGLKHPLITLSVFLKKLFYKFKARKWDNNPNLDS
jgi:UDP-MurNAc hydroxylase